ncbi:CyaY protein, partial [Psychrobacter sp. 1501(2011)]
KKVLGQMYTLGYQNKVKKIPQEPSLRVFSILRIFQNSIKTLILKAFSQLS